MFQTRTAIEYRAGAGAAVLPTIVDRAAEESREQRRRLAAEQALDQVLADSFPASDPPSWNPGIALLNPAVDVKPQAEPSESVAGTAARTGTSGIIDVSKSSGAERTFLQGVMSLGGAAGLALLFPFGILLVALPIALSIRGVLALVGLLFDVNVR
jgi:hypothetical protein